MLAIIPALIVCLLPGTNFVHPVIIMRLLPLLFIVFVIVPGWHAHAQENNISTEIIVPHGDFTDLKHTQSGRVDKVIDGLTVLLKDGTIIRLASIDIPDFHVWDNAIYSYAAQDLLQKTLLERTEVLVYQTRMAKKGRINRMKHELAHIVVKDSGVWIQGMLLANGLARTYTTPETPEMAGQMLEIEKTARAAKRGVWEDESDYHVLTPETATQAMGEFVIVEGIVESAATVRNNVYLNFGKDWKKDFTVMLDTNLRKQMARLGIDPLGMAHQKIRVRGWLREYNGPLIELEDVTHLEYPLEIIPADAPLPKETENPNLDTNPTGFEE